MTQVGRSGGATRAGRAGAVLALRRNVRLRRAAGSQGALLGLLVIAAACYALGAVTWPAWFPLAAVCLWVMLGGFFLRLRYLLVYDAVLVVAVALVSVLRSGPAPQPGVIVTVVIAGLLVLEYARARERVGVQGSLGDAMLVDLRERLLAQATIPPLAKGWQVDTVQRSAYGDSFSGDFLVASTSDDGRWLEVVLVDVSGKGQAAGTRSLLLSGAFGGLLGSLPRERFLVEANRYLLRQGWHEGFATAVHLAIDQGSGAFEVRGAGHPPSAHYVSGAGRWTVMHHPEQGPLLGVVPDAVFPARTGVLDRGDALLLYTDGLVERRGGDIGLGIDRLVGVAEHAVMRGLAGSARRIVEGVRAAVDDDRALVVVTRG